MKRFLVTLRTHACGPSDEFFVEVRSASVVSAIRDAVGVCRGMGPFALMRAQPWPRGVRCAEHAARRAAAAAG